MLRLVAFLCLLAVSSGAAAQAFSLPFSGQWFVLQGGDTPNVNEHMAVRAQWFGIDFAKVGGQGDRELAPASYARAQDFYSWGQQVLAPGDGVIVTVVNDLPDNPLGTKDATRPAGNHVVIRTVPDRFVFLAHFQRGSILVSQGEAVKSGQILGRCGNSGNSDFPHIHMHVQDKPEPGSGSGENQVFKNIDVQLNGKIFTDVTWPLIRGLFVAAH